MKNLRERYGLSKRKRIEEKSKGQITDIYLPYIKNNFFLLILTQKLMPNG